MDELLPEIAEIIFNYIPFRVSLNTVSIVCRRWHDLLLLSKKSILLTVDLNNITKKFHNNKIIAGKYNIQQLAVSHLGNSIYPLAAILNASPALNTLVISQMDQSGIFQDIIWRDLLIPRFFWQDTQISNLPVTFSKITRLIIPSDSISLLHLFPNARQIKLEGLEILQELHENNRCSFESVKEIETRVYDYGDLDITLLKKLFPNLETLYVICDTSVNEQAEEWRNIENTSKGSVTIHCRNFIPFPRRLDYRFSERTYLEYYFNYGETPLSSVLKRRLRVQELEEFLQRHTFLTAEYESDILTRDREVIFPSNSESYSVSPATPLQLKNLPEEIKITLLKHKLIADPESQSPTSEEKISSQNPVSTTSSVKIQSETGTNSAVNVDDIAIQLVPLSKQEDEAEQFWNTFRAGLTKFDPKNLQNHVVTKIKNYPIRNMLDQRTFAKYLFILVLEQSLVQLISKIGEETFATLINTRTTCGTVIHYLIAHDLDISWNAVADFVDWNSKDGLGNNPATLAFQAKKFHLWMKFLQFGADLQIEKIINSSSYINFYSSTNEAMWEVIEARDLKRWIFSYVIKETDAKIVIRVLDYVIDRLRLSKKEILTLVNRHLLADQFEVIFHLIDKYAIDMNNPDSNNEIALQIAINSKKIRAVNFVLSYGNTRFDTEISGAMTPLIYLCSMQLNTEEDVIFYHLAIDELMTLGDNINQIYIDPQGQKLTVIDVAKRAGNPIYSLVYYCTKYATLGESL
jgi:hypothetical protein